jgi:hypothetical protein
MGRWGEAAWHRRSGGKQRRCGGDGLPEECSGGGVDKMHGEGPFYSCISRRGNANLRKERAREVTARLSTTAERASASAAQSVARAAMAGLAWRRC